MCDFENIPDMDSEWASEGKRMGVSLGSGPIGPLDWLAQYSSRTFDAPGCGRFVLLLDGCSYFRDTPFHLYINKWRDIPETIDCLN